MGRTARCPSCGAAVEFKSVVSVLAVCDYCQSTLVREGKEIADLGKMAQLIEDRSPLQRGAEGRWQGLHFALIGRIQYRYDAGLWNEWHLLFDNGKSGWLSEAGGEYVMSLPRRVTEELPRFEALRVGEIQPLDGTGYRITNVLSAECVAGEGELPFKVGSGYAAPVVDLRSEAGGFATLDYSDDAARPLVFIGESVNFKSLGWANLRAKIPIPEINVKARAFNCPSCAAPLEIKHEAILSVGCPSCGAVLDTAHETVTLIARATERIGAVPFPTLGSKGLLGGEAVEAIGYMARRGDSGGESFRWNEWVLLGSDGKLLWLTNYDGHWNVGRVLQKAVRNLGGMKVGLDKEEYKHFATYSSTVECVVGEFPWQVHIAETAMVEDYIAPPRMLSHEVTDREETWTLLDYIEPDQVRQAFGRDEPLPAAHGVYANQVNPHAASHALVCSRFWKFFLLATAVHLVLLFWGGGRVLVNQALTFNDDDEPRLAREFRLDAPVSRLDIEHQTDIRNNWMSLGVTLVNKDTGDAWQATREISQYEGIEDGESWSEGSRSDELTFTNLPPGNYVLAEEADIGGSEPRMEALAVAAPSFDRFQPAPEPAARAPVAPVHAQLKIARAGPRWSSYFLLTVWLALFPIYTRIRRYGFESTRWAESDHPHVYGSSDGDGDGGDGGGD